MNSITLPIETAAHPTPVAPPVRPELSIIIINYKTRDLTINCIESIYEHTPEIPFEIILLDNGSDDEIEEKILKRFPHVKFIETGHNMGFAKANNFGMSNAHGEFLLLLNNDTRLIEPNLDELVGDMKRDPLMGVLGPRHIDGEGEFQLSCGKFPTLRSEFVRKLIHRRLSLNDYRLRDYLDGKYSNGSVVDWVSGSCLLVRREVLKEVGLFDERFFMYFEDVDLCRRVRDAGWKVAYAPDRTLIHYGGASVKKNLLSVMVENRRSQLYFSQKYYGRAGLWVVRFLLVFKYGLLFVRSVTSYVIARMTGQETRWAYTMSLLAKKVILIAVSRVPSRPEVPPFVHGSPASDEGVFRPEDDHQPQALRVASGSS